MAKIPVFSPGSAQLRTTSTASPYTKVGSAGAGMEELGGAISKSADFLYQKLDEARNFTEIAQAEAHDTQTQASELLRADTAVDKMGRPRQGSLEDMKDHDDVFKKDEETIRGYFSNRETEARYMAERAKSIMSTKSQIMRKYTGNMIDAGKAATINKVTSDIQNYATVPDEKKPFYEKMLKYNIAEGVRRGFLNETAAQKLQYDSIQDARYNAFLTDFRAKPEETEAKFLAGKYGLDIETSEKARVRLKEIKAIRREAEGELYGDMSLRVTTSQLSEKEIDAAVEAYKLNSNEGITPAHGKSLKSALYKDITKRIGAKEYAKHKKAIDFIFSNSTQDRMKGYEAILEAYDDGLTSDESAFLTKILRTKKDVTFANKAAAGKKMLEQLFGARPKDVAYETKSLLNYARRIANGSDPEQAAQDTAMEVIKEDHPAVVANPDLAGAFSPRKGYKAIPKVKQETK